VNIVFEKEDFLNSFYLFEDSALIYGDLGENDIMQTIRVMRNKIWNLWNKKREKLKLNQIKNLNGCKIDKELKNRLGVIETKKLTNPMSHYYYKY